MEEEKGRLETEPLFNPEVIILLNLRQYVEQYRELNIDIEDVYANSVKKYFEDFQKMYCELYNQGTTTVKLASSAEKYISSIVLKELEKVLDENKLEKITKENSKKK